MSERVTCATEGSNAVSEAVERIVEACEDKRSDVMNHLALERVDSPGALALAGMEVGISEVLALLRSRDWSKGEGE